MYYIKFINYITRNYLNDKNLWLKQTFDLNVMIYYNHPKIYGYNQLNITFEKSISY